MLDTTLAYGLSFLFPARDNAVGACLRNHGEFARVELDFFTDHAAGQGTLIDVGANIGAIALPFARARPDWRVLAIEAHRGLHGLLAANALNNRLFNVEVFHAAAGAEPGLPDFPATPLSDEMNFGTLGFGRTATVTERVRMLTLDEIAPADTRLVKIDVEGYEPEVLRGARDLLGRRSAIWLTEASIQNPEPSAQTIRTLMEAGYAVHWLFAPFATPASAKARPATPGRGDANVVALPPGVPNRWNLPLISDPSERRPSGADAYPYLARYGFA